MKQGIFKSKPREAYEYNINRAFLGIFAVIIGLVFLINNLNIYPLRIDFSVLWPLFIVFVGLSLFKKKNIISTTVGSIITIICVSLFFYSVALYTTNTVDVVYQNNITPIVVAKDINLEKADIELDVGPGEINVYGIDSDNLIEGRLMTSMMRSEVSQSINGPVQKVNISLQGKNEMARGADLKNQFNIGIDKKVPLDFVLNSGGSNNNIDLSEIRAENIKISTGASNLSLKLGDNVDSSVTIEAGASSVNISLPETTGVQIKIESGFSSQELPGFSLVGDNVYQSLDYNSKDKKINIDITMGMVSLKVDWFSPLVKKEISPI